MTVQREVVEAVVQGNSTSAVRAAKAAGTGFHGMGQQAAAADKKTRGLGQAMQSVKASLMAGVAAGGLMVAGLDRLADRAVEVTNVQSAMKFSVDAAAEAVGHQTDKLKLAAEANKLATAGLITSSGQYAKFTGIIARLADAQGIDLDTAIQKATKSALKGTDAFLKQVGIYSDLEAEQRKLGRSMTTVERQQYVLNKLMNEGADLADAYGASVDKAGQKWVAFKNQLVDIRDEALDVEGNLASLRKEILDLAVTVQMDFGASVQGAEKNIVRMGEAGDLWLSSMTLQFDDAALAAERLWKGTNLVASSMEKVAAANAKLANQRAQEKGAIAGTQAAADSMGASLDDYEASLMGPLPGATSEDFKPKKKRGRGGRGGSKAKPQIDTVELVFFRGRLMTNEEADRMREHSASFTEIMQEDSIESEQAAEERRIEAQERNRDRLLAIQEQIAKGEEEAQQRRIEAWAMSSRMVGGFIDLTNQAVQLSTLTMAKEGEKAQKRHGQIQGAMTMIGASREVFEAARSYAAYDIPGGVLHTLAAGLGFTTGGILLSGSYLKGDPSGGGGKTGGYHSNPIADAQRGMGGGGGGGGGGGYGGSGGPGFQPLSPVDEDLQRSRGVMPGNNRNSGTTYQINNPTFIGEGAGRELDQMQRKTRRTQGVMGG